MRMLPRGTGDSYVLVLLTWVLVSHLHGCVCAQRSFEPSYTSSIVKEWIHGVPGEDRSNGSWLNTSIREVGNGQSGCPRITLQEKSLLLRWRNIPTFVVFSGQFYQRYLVRTRCGLDGGEMFEPVFTPLVVDRFAGAGENGNIRSYNGVPYIHLYPQAVVGSLNCGEVMHCDVDIVDSFAGSIGDDPRVITKLATGGCDYDYRNFVQWGFKQKGLGFTCDEGSVYFTLMCEVCVPYVVGFRNLDCSHNVS